MNIRTIESDFEYQIKEVLKNMQDDYQDYVENCEGEPRSFSDWLWREEIAEFGSQVFQAVDNWCGMDELINEIQ
jgi:hypothetical protein